MNEKDEKPEAQVQDQPPTPCVNPQVIGTHNFCEEGIKSNVAISIDGKNIFFHGSMMVNLLHLEGEGGKLSEMPIEFNVDKHYILGERPPGLDAILTTITTELYHSLLGVLQRGNIEIDIIAEDKLSYVHKKLRVVGCLRHTPKPKIIEEEAPPKKDDTAAGPGANGIQCSEICQERPNDTGQD